MPNAPKCGDDRHTAKSTKKSKDKDQPEAGILDARLDCDSSAIKRGQPEKGRRHIATGEAEAVVEAAQRRLRPILLTTATTIGGLIPLWLGGGAMFSAMAVAILFGLAFATVLTLGFVPVLYALFFRVKFTDLEA